MATFNCIAEMYNGAWHCDYEFVDQSPKSLRRMWTLTHDLRTDSWHATLRRADHNEAEFDDGISLPTKMVEMLRSSLPDDGLGLRLNMRGTYAV